MATDKTVLDFTEITDSEDADILYAIRGTTSTRDKKTTKASFLAPDRLKGIATYDATFEYLADNSIVQHDNLIWRSIYGTTGTPNVGNTPGIANLDKWELVSVITTALNITSTGSITQTVTDLFITSDTTAGDNVITIPDGVRVGQKFTVLSIGVNETSFSGTGIGSNIILNDGEKIEFIWCIDTWKDSANIITRDNITYTSPTLLGSGLTISGIIHTSVTALSSTDIAFIDSIIEELRTYRFNGTTWSQVGSGLSISGISESAMAALSSTDIAFIESAVAELRTYRFNGTTWSQVGSGLSISGISDPAVTALSSTDIAFIDSIKKELRTYRFNGTTWSQVGSGLSISGIAGPAVTALSSTDIAFIDSSNDELRTYRFNGTTWSQVGSGLSISGIASPAVTALSSTDIAFIDSTVAELRSCRWNSNNESWSLTNNAFTISGIAAPSITALSSADIAFIDATIEELRTYRFNQAITW